MDAVPQVGAVVFRTDSTPPRILLVRARKDPDKWIFPKGHIEPGESDADAVLRELKEEAGVAGMLLGPVGTPVSFQSDAEPVRVQYYLLRMTADGPSPEGREKQWLPAREAIEGLGFEAARELLRAGLPEIERHTAATGTAPAQDSFADYLLAAHAAGSLLDAGAHVGRREAHPRRRVVARRIAVAGASGNGKTTLSKRLAAKLGVPYVELDALNHLPGWTEATPEALRRDVEAAMNRSDGWVLDGTYQNKIGDVVLRRADTLVWLDQSLPLIVWRDAQCATSSPSETSSRGTARRGDSRSGVATR